MSWVQAAQRVGRSVRRRVQEGPGAPGRGRLSGRWPCRYQGAAVARRDVRYHQEVQKQKGGGARHGDYRAPIFVGGGVTFAAKPRSYEQKVNRKAYRVAIRSIFSELVRQGRLKVVESFGIETPKTSAMVAKLAELDVSGRVLLVSEDASESVFLPRATFPTSTCWM